MANQLYDKGRQKFLGKDLGWDDDAIKVVLVRTSGGYTVNLSTHEFLSDIAVGDRLAISAALGSKTITAGIADAGDATFTGMSSVLVAGAAVIFHDTGVAATSSLIGYLDTVTNLPKDLTGITIATMVWSNGTNKIFKL